MIKKSDDKRQKPENSLNQKKSYIKPQFTEYGHVGQLTKGGVVHIPYNDAGATKRVWA